MLAPVEIASFLRAPYGWTNRMRREQGWPARGAGGKVVTDLRANVVLGLAFYGGPVSGALFGRQVWGGVLGAGIGLVLGTCVGIALVPLTSVWWERPGRRVHPDAAGTAPDMSLHPDEPNEGPLTEPDQDPVPPGEDPSDDPSPEPDLA